MIDKFNEKTTVKKMMKSGFVDKKNIISQLTSYGTYFKVKGCKEKEIEAEIIAFCEKNMKNFNYVKSFNTIKRVMENVKGRDRLKEIGIMNVKKHEIDYINSLDLSIDHKKMLFTFLILGKIQFDFKGNYYLNNSFSDLFKRANVAIKKKYDILGTLNKMGLIRVGERLSVECKFIKELNVENAEDCMVVWDFDHVGWSYEQHLNPKKFFICEGTECNKIFKKTNNKQKYCKECAIKNDRNKAKERMKKIRQ